MARELEGNWTEFTPHYIVWVCPEAYRDSEECKSQCIHQGRYCTPDPDGDLTAGYSGADIVQARPRARGLGCVLALRRCSVTESVGFPLHMHARANVAAEPQLQVISQASELCGSLLGVGTLQA